MAKNSCNKGKVGERAAAAYLTSLGFPATRGQQHRGGPDSPDVLCQALKGWHFEIKFGSRAYINFGKTLDAALAKARADCGDAEAEAVGVLWYQTGGIRRWILTTDPESHHVGKLAIFGRLTFR